MKKLMLAAAVICATVAANAASVNWSSGSIQTPSDSGELSGSRLTTASGYNISMYVWEALSAEAVSYSAGDLFTWYNNGATDTKDPFGGSTAAISAKPTVGASATTASINGKLIPETEGDNVYAAVLFVLTDSTTGEAKWYMENAAERATAKSVTTQGSLALKVGGTGAATSWTAAAVPEPTSGLLLLLGMAGLALRRRRA